MNPYKTLAGENAFYDEAFTENLRQDKKWGPQRNHTQEKWLAILTEEVGEVAKAILEHDQDNLREELVQVAAVAAAFAARLPR